jgi:hypothetical protein
MERVTVASVTGLPATGLPATGLPATGPPPTAVQPMSIRPGAAWRERPARSGPEPPRPSSMSATGHPSKGGTFEQPSSILNFLPRLFRRPPSRARVRSTRRAPFQALFAKSNAIVEPKRSKAQPRRRSPPTNASTMVKPSVASRSRASARGASSGPPPSPRPRHRDRMVPPGVSPLETVTWWKRSPASNRPLYRAAMHGPL